MSGPVDVTSTNIRWKVKAYSYQGIYSCPFEFQCEEWQLFYVYVRIGGPQLALLKLKSRSDLSLTFGFSVRLEGSRTGLKREMRLKEGSCCHIWEMSYPELAKEYPELHRYDGELCFLLEFKAEDKVPTGTDDWSQNTKGYESLSRDFAKLLDEAPNTDVQLLCGDLTVPAHRTILSARSDVFQKMLETDMVEKRTGCVKIPDIQPEVIREFVRYLYAGTLPEMTVQMALQLYAAGDKYNVPSLVEQCASYLAASIEDDNACEILKLADDHSEEELKELAFRYIFKNKIPLKKEYWKEFSVQCPKLALEAFQFAYENMNDS